MAGQVLTDGGMKGSERTWAEDLLKRRWEIECHSEDYIVLVEGWWMGGHY